MDRILQFCGFREFVNLAHVNAQWRALPEVAQVITAMRRATSGHGLEYLGEYRRTLNIAPILYESRVERRDVTARIAASLAETGMLQVARTIKVREQFERDDIDNAAIFSSIHAGIARDKYDVRAFAKHCPGVANMLISLIISQRAIPKHYEIFDELTNVEGIERYAREQYIAHAFALDLTTRSDARDLIEKLFDDGCIDARFARIIRNRSEILHYLEQSRAIACEIGPKFAHYLQNHECDLHLVAHFASDTAIFTECLKTARVRKYWSVAAYIGHAAMNQDDRAIDCVIDLMGWNRESSIDVITLPWNAGFGVDALRRAIARVESRGFRVACAETLDRCATSLLSLSFADVLECVNIAYSYEHRVDSRTCARFVAMQLHCSDLCIRYGDAVRAVLAKYA